MAWLDEFRKVNPWASEHSDDFVVRYAANNMGMNPHTLAYQAGVDLDNSSDAVKSLKAGVWNAVTAPVGLANIPVAMVTGHNLVSDGWGEIGKITGVQPSRWADEARYAQSPELQAERQAIDNAWQNGSFLDAAAETLQRPSALGHTLLESAPSMVGGLGLAKGLLSAGARGVARGAAGPALPGFLERQFGARAAAIAAGAGEGAFAGGQAMERSAQNPNIDPHTGALAALGTMATTGALGYLGGRLGDKIGGKFGVGDMEADILRGKFLHSSAPVYKRAPMAMLQEGVLEEAPQSALEQGWQNLAEGKPLTEGMGRQAFEGGLAGAALGGGMKLPGWYSKPATAKPGEPIDLLPRSEPAHDASALQEPVQPVGLNPIRGIYNDPAPNNADSMRAALDEVTGMVGDRQITAWEELQAAHPGVFPKFKSLAPTAPLAEEPQAPAAPKLTKRAAKMQATITSMVENGASEVELAHATELMQANKLGELNTFAKQVAEVRSEPVPIMPVPPEVALQQKAQEQQAQQALPAVAAQQPAVAPVLDAGEVISGVGPLPEVQGAVWQHLMKALNNGDLNDYIDSGNVIQYTKIADELGLDRGSVKMAVNGVMNRIAKTQGVSVDQVKSAMRSSVAGVRTTEMAPYDALGLHPEAQSRVNEAESYLGGEGGQVQTMGVINSIRGSQGKIGPNEAPPGYEWSAAPSENAQRHAQMERALAPREEGTLLPAGDAAILDAVAKRVLDAQLVDVQDAREEYDGGLQRDDASFDQLSFEHRVQFVRAYISWNDNVLSAPEFNRVREGIADEYRTKVKRGAQDQQRGAPLQVSDSGRHQERPALASAVGNGGDSVVPRSEVPADGRGLSNPDESWRDLDHTDTIHYSESNGVANPSSVDKIHAVIDKAFFTPARARSLVEVYATQEEAAAHYADQLSQAKGKVQAFVTQDGKIVMIAGNIAEGHEMAVFLHEVGVHVGMKKLIGEANYEWLTQRVEEWAQRNDGSVESRVAKQALTRAENSSSQDKRGEIIAYMVEGLVDAGVTPQAAGQTEGHRWFRRLWAAAKSALRKLGFKNPDKITGQHLVDLAYGAADLELRGAWHGTAAQFRKFDHNYMGSGEGAQAFGWGTYLAQRVGIAKGYWVADVGRKGGGSVFATELRERLATGVFDGGSNADIQENYAGGRMSERELRNQLKIAEKKEGALMRVATNVRDDEFLDWDKPLSEQSEKVKAMLGKPQDVLNLVQAHGRNDLHGVGIYRALENKLGSDKAASEYLDSLGIKGIRFLDAQSRQGNANQIHNLVIFNDKNLVRVSSQIGARQDSDSIRFSQDENDDLDFTQPSSTIELRKRGTPTPKGIARAKKLYGGAEGYARYDEAAKEFFDYVKPWVDRTALKGRTDIQALVQRLRVASDARYKELSSSDTDGTGNGMLRSKSSGIGGLGGYSTVFDDSEGSPSLIVVTDDQIARAKKEAAEYGLKASDVLHAQGETLRLVMHDDGELVIYGPRADTKYFQDLKAEGLADVCRDADGNILYLADGVPWTRLTKATFTELIPLLADMHARIRLYTGREHTGVWWRRATGATGNAGTNPLEERSGAIYFSEAAEGPTRAPQLGNYAEATIAERIKYSMEKAGILANKALHKVVFLTDLVDIAEKAGLKSARAFERFVGEKDEIRTRIEEQYGRTMERAAALKDKNLVDAFLRASTIDGKWGYDDNPHKVKADPEMAKQFAGLSAEGQRVVREIFATGNEMYSRIRSLAEAETRREYGKLIAAARGNDAKAADLQKDLQKSLASIERSMPKRDTPYAPLKRFGDYLVTFKSKDYLVAEADGNQKRMREMKGQGHHYQVWAFEDAAEAAFQADKLRTQTDGEVRNFHKQESYKQLDELPWSAVAKVKNAIDNDPDSKNSTALKKLVTDMYLQMLAETSARKSEMNRQKVVGSGEMLRAFAAHGRSTAHFVASMAKSGEIANAMTDMKAEAHGNTDRNTVYNELAQRYARSLDFNPTPVADKMMRITSMWMLLTSPAYYINNMTQPFMLTLPVLGGTYRGRAWPALVQAYKDVAKYVGKMGVELDLNSLPISADEKAMLSTLRDQGKIDITVASDMGRWAEGEVDQGPFARVSHLMSSAVSKVEALNRIVSALAAYRLSGGSVEYAGKVIDRTQGNYSSTNAPRFFAANGATKLITQFRKYQLIQLSLIGRLLHTSFAGASADEKLAARKAFAWMFAQHLAVTGLKGAPLAAVGMMLAAAIGGDDDKDWERNLRRWIGDDDVATVLIRGIPAGLGLDVSERIGMSNTFSLLPFAEMPADRTGYEKAAASALGPASALVGNAFDAWGKMRNGQYSKAVELLSPSLIKNSLQGYRIATDGITDSRGNVRLNADEISFFDGFMQAVGLPTTAKTEFQNKRGDLIELSKHFDSREDRIRAQYINAKRTGDTGEMAEAREAWQEVQRSKREWMTSMRDRGFTNPALLKQLKPRPLASLLKAPQRQAQQDRAWSSVSMR